MSYDEERAHLFDRLGEVLGREGARTLMNMLPPGGWGDVARQRDVDSVRTELRAEVIALRSDVELLRTELRTEVSGLRTDLESVRTELRTEVSGLRTDLESVRTELRTEVSGLRTDLESVRTELRSEVRDLGADLKLTFVRATAATIFSTWGLLIAMFALQ